MSKKGNNAAGVLAGLLAGAAAGLVLGMLYAPEEGTETRKKIKNKANELKDQAVDQYGKVSEKANFIIYNMTGQVVNKGKVIDNKVQVSQLQKGAYIISVDNAGEVTKVKFIKK